MAIPATGYEYEDDAISDGALHYYPMFDLFVPNIITDILKGEQATIHNDQDNNVIIRNGIIGYSADLTANGGGASHSVISSSFDPTNLTTYSSWTVYFWVNFKSFNSAAQPCLIDFTGTEGFVIYYDYPATTNADTINVQFTNSSIGALSIQHTPTINSNHLFVVTSDLSTNTVNVYYDNVLLLSSTQSYQDLSLYSSSWYLGDRNSSPSSTTYVDGIVDELGIFNRALNTSEISTLWNSGAGIELVKYANNHRLFPSETIGEKASSSIAFHSVASSILGIDTDSGSDWELKAVAEALETIGDNDTQTAVLVAFPESSETLGLDDTEANNLTIPYYVSDGYGFISGFSVNGEAYIGVVANTETSSITEYDGFTFNAFAYDGKRFLASDGSGIVELTGDDDDGSNIQAYITTKLLSFKSGTQKRIDRAYLGLRNGAPMVLKVIARDENDVKKEYWYELEETSTALRDVRIKIGKGIKAHYLQFTLSNNQGGDFELDSLEFKPIILRRRV